MEKRKHGHPKLRYKDVVKRDLKKIQVDHTTKWDMTIKEALTGEGLT